MSSIGIGANVAGQLLGQSQNLQPTTYTDQNGLYSQSENQAVYTDFKIRHHYERDFHRYMLATTSPLAASPAAFVQLGNTTLLWVVDWTGCQFLTKTVIPDPSVVNPGWVLLDAWLEPFMTMLAPNGTTPLYRISGVYVYGHTNPGPFIYSNTSYPVAPWIIDKEGGDGVDGMMMRTIDANDLQGFLLEPAALVNPVATPMPKPLKPTT